MHQIFNTKKIIISTLALEKYHKLKTLYCHLILMNFDKTTTILSTEIKMFVH